ncbi:hypothetical protein A9Q86_15545 [Flavobacteriales bacterium 33_180_T64]|nr:hypothetical protein A9Q86_15545 [Flavobacteriales bacterium 33_180_T64]
MKSDYEHLKTELQHELIRLADFWISNCIDYQNGGFVSELDNENLVRQNSSKGVILNTRILWGFSAISNHLKTQEYKAICERSFTYLKKFNDNVHKGLYWELNHKGHVLDSTKNSLAQAHAIYALSEYYLFSRNEEAKLWAIEIFETIESNAKLKTGLGYLDNFNEIWHPTSPNPNTKRLGTHIHFLEAYTSLLKIHQSQALKNSIKTIIETILTRFLHKDFYFETIMDVDWNPVSEHVSFGHNAEVSWILVEAAQALNDPILIKQTELTLIDVTNKLITEAITNLGSVLHKRTVETNKTDTNILWWTQTEALIALFYANSIQPNNDIYIKVSIKIWEFIKEYFINHTYGEWYALLDSNGNPNPKEYKVGMWKSLYHNARLCIKLNK